MRGVQGCGCVLGGRHSDTGGERGLGGGGRVVGAAWLIRPFLGGNDMNGEQVCEGEGV